MKNFACALAVLLLVFTGCDPLDDRETEVSPATEDAPVTPAGG